MVHKDLPSPQPQSVYTNAAETPSIPDGGGNIHQWIAPRAHNNTGYFEDFVMLAGYQTYLLIPLKIKFHTSANGNGDIIVSTHSDTQGRGQYSK